MLFEHQLVTAGKSTGSTLQRLLRRGAILMLIHKVLDQELPLAGSKRTESASLGEMGFAVLFQALPGLKADLAAGTLQLRVLALHVALKGCLAAAREVTVWTDHASCFLVQSLAMLLQGSL